MNPIQRASLSVVIIALCSAACSKRDSMGADSAALRVVAHGNDTAFYALRTVDGQDLPHRFADNPGECIDDFHGGWYKIIGERWVSVDSLERTCNEQAKFLEHLPTLAGEVLRHSHDTLFFVGPDSHGNPATLDRGVLRGDTLITSGEDFGPQRLYMRVRSR